MPTLRRCRGIVVTGVWRGLAMRKRLHIRSGLAAAANDCRYGFVVLARALAFQ